MILSILECCAVSTTMLEGCKYILFMLSILSNVTLLQAGSHKDGSVEKEKGEMIEVEIFHKVMVVDYHMKMDDYSHKVSWI